MPEIFSHWSIQICENEVFIFSPLSGKNTIFSNIWDIFTMKQGGVTSQRSRIKIWQILFHPNDSWSTSCKKILFQMFSSFKASDHKGHFGKILTRIFKFGWLSFYHSYIFKKLKLNYLLLNLMLVRLPQISNPRNEKPKSLYVLF